MNKFFSTQDGLCLAVTDEQNREKLMVFKYHKDSGKLEVSTMEGDTIGDITKSFLTATRANR